MTDAELKSRIDSLNKQVGEIDRTLADSTYFDSLDPKDAAGRKEALEAARASYNARIKELYGELSDVRGDRPPRKDIGTSRDPGPVFADDSEPVEYESSSASPSGPGTSGNDFLRHIGNAVGVPASLLPKRAAPTIDLPEPKAGESATDYDARSKAMADSQKKAADQADQLSGDLISMAIKAVIGQVERMAKAPAVIGEAAASATFAEKPTDFLHSGGRAIQGFGDLVSGIPVVGDAISGVGKFVSAVGGAVDQLNKWSDGLHNTNMGFAEFSAGMAQVQAESQVRKIVLDQQRGDARAEAARRLSEARDRRERAQGELMDAFHNKVSAPAMTVVETYLGDIFDWLKTKFGAPDAPKQFGGLAGWADDITDTLFSQEYGAPLGQMNKQEREALLNRIK